MRDRFAHPAWLLLLAPIVWVCLWHRLGEMAIQVVDERVYLDVSRNMLQRHNWSDPWYFDDRYAGKPPLRMWVGALLFRLFGQSEWMVRLPDAVFASLTVLLVWHLARTYLGGPATVAAPLVFVTAHYPLSVHGWRQGMTEAMLTFAMTAAIACFLAAERASGRHRFTLTILLGAWVSVAAMVKSFAAFLAYVPMAVYLVARRRARDLLRPASFVALGISIAPWLAYYLFQSNVGGEVRFNLVARFGEWKEEHSAWQYAQWLWEGLKPWSYLLPAAIVLAVARARRQSFDLWLLLWGFALTAPWAFARVKHPWYQFPSYPAWALLIAALLFPRSLWIGKSAGPRNAIWRLGGGVVFVALGAVAVVAAWATSCDNPRARLQRAVAWIRSLPENERTIAVFTEPQLLLPEERYYLDRASGRVVYAPSVADVMGLAIDEPRLLIMAPEREAQSLLRQLAPLHREVRGLVAPVSGGRLRNGREIPNRLLLAVGSPPPGEPFAATGVFFGDGFLDLESDADGVHAWTSQRATLALPIPGCAEVGFELKSFHAPRRVRVRGPGIDIELRVPPEGAPVALQMDVPADGGICEIVSLDGCTAPSEIDPAVTDTRCLAVGVYNPSYRPAR